LPHTGRVCFWILMLTVAVFVAATLNDLPTTVATHFGGLGRPNAWMSRGTYAGYMAAIGVLLPILAVYIVSRRSGLEDPSWWLGCLLVGFALGLHLVIRAANRTQPPQLPTAGFLTVLGLFVVGLATWVRGPLRKAASPQA